MIIIDRSDDDKTSKIIQNVPKIPRAQKNVVKKESCGNTSEWEKTLFKLILVYLFLVTSFGL